MNFPRLPRAAVASVALFCTAFALCGAEPIPLAWPADGAWRTVSPNKLGINANYLFDGAIPAAQLAAEWRRIGARWVRYPGGEKSDNHLWAEPPYERVRPRTALAGGWAWPAGEERFFTAKDGRTWAVDPLDFDEFIATCRAVGAEPVVVICQQAAFRPKDERFGAIDEATLIEAARAWVAYSHRKGYRVRYWEIGNEPYLDDGQTADAFARSWQRFARAMKEADPEIEVGLNGPDMARHVGRAPADQAAATLWWPAVLAVVGAEIDWVSVHDYPCFGWKSYRRYETQPVQTDTALQRIRETLKAGAGKRGGEIPLLVTETNSADWLGHPKQLGWSHASSLGHGLVLFDMLGQYLLDPGVRGVMVWNTRWLDHATRPELWDAFAPDGSLRPTGEALATWAAHPPEELAVVSAPPALRVYAGRGADGRRTLFVLNKGPDAATVAPPAGVGAGTQWSGASPDDPSPAWRSLALEPEVRLPAASLTVFAEPSAKVD